MFSHNDPILSHSVKGKAHSTAARSAVAVSEQQLDACVWAQEQLIRQCRYLIARCNHAYRYTVIVILKDTIVIQDRQNHCGAVLFKIQLKIKICEMFYQRQMAVNDILLK